MEQIRHGTVMGRRAAVAYTMGPSEIMMHTRGGWIRVNRKLWHAQAVQLRKLEPALTEKVLDLATGLVPETFPQGVQDAITEAIHEIDLRFSYLSKSFAKWELTTGLETIRLQI